MSDFLSAPVCIISYNRPDYLAQTLESIADSMAFCGMCGPVVLFQDGAVENSEGNNSVAAEIDACIAAFRRIVPAGLCIVARGNLGIARNIYRAENWAFEECQYPVAFFFEDDLILARGYFRMMEKLYALAKANPRIGMFSAYGADHRLSVESQQSVRDKVGSMHHNWGFGLTRKAWVEREKLTRDYMRLLADVSYADRPLGKIAAWYAQMGWPVMPTNQDIAKNIALHTLGMVRVTSFVACGKYIGVVGQHYTRDQYEDLGFGEVQLYDSEDELDEIELVPLDDAAIDRLHAEERAFLLTMAQPYSVLLEDPEIVRLLPLIEGMQGHAGSVALVAGIRGNVSGLWTDGWCGPQFTLRLETAIAVRSITLTGIAPPHLANAVTYSVICNGIAWCETTAEPGAKFVLDLAIPKSLAGLPITIRVECPTRLSPYTLRYNDDRRVLGFLLESIEIGRPDQRVVLSPADLNAAMGAHA